MRLPPNPPGYSPTNAGSYFPTRSQPNYYYSSWPYRQTEEELQQQAVYVPNYYSYYSGYGSNNPWLSTNSRGYWHSYYVPQNHHSHAATYSWPISDTQSSIQQQFKKTELKKAEELKLKEKLHQKRMAELKLAEKNLQQKSIAEWAELQKARSKSTKSTRSALKGSASSRGGFGPSGVTTHISAAA